MCTTSYSNTSLKKDYRNSSWCCFFYAGMYLLWGHSKLNTTHEIHFAIQQTSKQAWRREREERSSLHKPVHALKHSTHKWTTFLNLHRVVFFFMGEMNFSPYCLGCHGNLSTSFPILCIWSVISELFFFLNSWYSLNIMACNYLWPYGKRKKCMLLSSKPYNIKLVFIHLILYTFHIEFLTLIIFCCCCFFINLYVIPFLTVSIDLTVFHFFFSLTRCCFGTSSRIVWLIYVHFNNKITEWRIKSNTPFCRASNSYHTWLLHAWPY